MKWVVIILGGLVGLLLVAALVLWSLGFRDGAGRIAGSIEIDRPPAEVWPWIVEGEKVKQWVSWLTEVHDLTPDLEGVGSRVRWIMIDPNMNNQRVQIDAEYTAYQPATLSSVSLDSPGMFTGTGQYALTDLGAGRTRVDYLSEYRMSSWVWRLREPVVTPSARRKAEEDLARLKTVVEADPQAIGAQL
jgi:uncharacterized protein YndB with AHSA1/START domain